MQERREAWGATGQAGDDLLGVLLQAQDEEGRQLSDEELWEDVHDIMGAGHETTASTTTAALYCISQTPGVEEKVGARNIAFSREYVRFGSLRRSGFICFRPSFLVQFLGEHPDAYVIPVRKFCCLPY